MRNRDYKESGKGEYCHIYNRGNAKQDIFLDEEDFRFFLLRLRQNLFPQEVGGLRIIPLPAGSFSLICYCLMPNHFHLLLRQDADISPSKLILKVCTSYSMYFNKRYESVGHVFQDQFKQIIVHSDEYLLWLSAYIHLNPVMGHIAHDAGQYPWSSYDEFLGGRGAFLCKPSIVLDQFKNQIGYKTFVQSALPQIKERKELEQFYLD